MALAGTGVPPVMEVSGTTKTRTEEVLEVLPSR